MVLAKMWSYRNSHFMHFIKYFPSCCKVMHDPGFILLYFPTEMALRGIRQVNPNLFENYRPVLWKTIFPQMEEGNCMSHKGACRIPTQLTKKVLLVCSDASVIWQGDKTGNDVSNGEWPTQIKIFLLPLTGLLLVKVPGSNRPWNLAHSSGVKAHCYIPINIHNIFQLEIAQLPKQEKTEETNCDQEYLITITRHSQVKG